MTKPDLLLAICRDHGQPCCVKPDGSFILYMDYYLSETPGHTEEIEVSTVNQLLIELGY